MPTVDYDPTWPQTFAALVCGVGAALEPLAVRIVHVDGTAIPGFPAQPIIDMIAVIPSREDLTEAIGRLASVG